MMNAPIRSSHLIPLRCAMCSRLAHDSASQPAFDRGVNAYRRRLCSVFSFQYSDFRKADRSFNAEIAETAEERGTRMLTNLVAPGSRLLSVQQLSRIGIQNLSG